MLKGARIAFNHGSSVLSVVIRDMSETGARVTLENSIGVPEDVQLVLDDGTIYACKIVRRQLNELGLRFL